MTLNMCKEAKMEFLDLARARYSVRSYKDTPVEEEKLQCILEAGRLAPTACNLQAFRIVVIPTANHLSALKKLYRGSFLTQAPVVLGVYADTQQSWTRSDGTSYAAVDAAIVMDHMILQASALGLGTCWIGAFDVQTARELGGLGRDFEPVAFTPVGYTDSQPSQKQRKPLSDIVKYL
jgi:nitroreductase